MNDRRLISTRAFVVVVALMVAAAGTIYEVRVVADQRLQRQTLQQHLAQQEQQAAALRRERDDMLKELKIAEHQLAELPPLPGSIQSEAARARSVEVKAWLARVKRLKQLFEQQPGQRIPEMRLLTDDDWLRVGKRISLDTDENVRKALAAARDAAKNRFRSPLSAAVRKFVKSANGEQPPTAMALAPYLDNLADADALQRYEITSMGLKVFGSPVWVVEDKSPIDADFDGRLQITSSGSMSLLGAPMAWIPNYQERVGQAYRSYAEANHGASATELATLLPFVNPPFDPATVEKLLKADRERTP